MATSVKNKADKKAPAKKTPAKEGKVELNGASRMSILKSTANPCREGSAAHALFESLRPMKKVQEALDAKVDRGYLKTWIAKGLVKIG